jgi:hypothetical protein
MLPAFHRMAEQPPHLVNREVGGGILDQSRERAYIQIVNQSLGKRRFSNSAPSFQKDTTRTGIRNEVFQPPDYGRLTDNLV